MECKIAIQKEANRLSGLKHEGVVVSLDSLLIGENASYIDELYVQWQANPSNVSEDWQALFSSWETETESCAAPVFPKRSIFAAGGVDESQAAAVADRQAKVAQLINAYRVRGHTEAGIDPLGRKSIQEHPELTLEYYGLTEADLDVPVSGHGVYGVPAITTAREIISRLRKAYCSGFGVEFMNINDPVKKKWLQERLETLPDRSVLSVADQKHMLRNLADAENFERFLHQQYQYTKRFSLEGAEPLIPLLAVLIDTIGDRGAERVMLGMAHRGRLNVLANICNKPVQYILNEFNDEVYDSFDISGDVKYHLGYSNDYTTVNNKKVRITMAFNPSHLEAVNPVVLGRSRARQDRLIVSEGYSEEAAMNAVAPMLIHGDAAFAGQGVVAEVLNMSGLDGYQTGGTIHVVVNNQIGFTTSPVDARSTPYCTDVARMLAVPIFHVNGEDIEAVAAVAKLAAEWRQTFHQDVFIDMYCFRKWGHNEGDEPSFTQPLLYDAIRKHKSAKAQYCEKIVASGTLSSEEVEAIVSDSADRLQKCLEDDLSFDTYTTAGETELTHRWTDINQDKTEVETAVDAERLNDVLTTVNTIPDSVKIHRKVQRIMAQRLEMVKGNLPVDWALAEQAAYATLVQDGFRVRISGQDVGRGTFSHRHAVLTDVNTGAEYLPIANLSATVEPEGVVRAGPAARAMATERGVDLNGVEGSGRNGRILTQDVHAAPVNTAAPFEVHNSLLSEYAVLGFEHGYTLDYPEGLVIWEAQFGDFANGAQIMIDNFIMATEQKWDRYSGLVMLLPHGYEGQGPEHSSARLERFLQLCAEDNVVVANVTTPANFFHLMRRQMLRNLRKPLVVMSPKSLLRHPRCISTLDDLSTGAFQKMLMDPMLSDGDFDAKSVEHVVFCSGKIYYDLLAHREMIERFQGSSDEAEREKVRVYLKKFASFGILKRLEAGETIDTKRIVLTRLEQLYPFPEAEILAHLQAFGSKGQGPELHWCQEEPKNMGAWPMVDEWFSDALDARVMKYIGRKRSASPATGSPKIHKAEQASIVNGVFSL